MNPTRHGFRGFLTAGALAALIVLLESSLAAEMEPKNLVLNGDFSQLEKGRPVGWASSGDQNVDQKLEIVSDQGNPCARLTCTRCDRSGGASHAMIAQVGAIKLEKGKYYEFSCRAREEGLAGRTVNVALNDTSSWQSCGLSTELRLGTSWKAFRAVFRATRPVDKTGRLQIWYHEPGILWLDDVKIVEAAATESEFTDVVAPRGGKNLVPNGSFEVGAAGWSSLGRGAGWGNLARLHGRIETAGGTHGRSFLRIPLGGDRTPVLYFDYLRPVVRRELQPLAASLGWIKVEPGRPYTISCDLRASVDGAGAALGVRAKDPTGGSADQRQKVALSTAWKRYSYTFRPARRYVFVTVGPDLDKELDVDVDVDAVQLEKGERATEFEPRGAVEIAVEPSVFGGAFSAGERASLVVRACNHAASPRDARVDFACTDYFDKPVSLPAVSLEIPAGASLERDVPLPSEWKGHFRIRANWRTDGKTESRTINVALVPRPATGDSVAGINHAFATADLIQQAKKAGVTWYRDWSLKWQDLEPEPGQWRWQVGDAQLDRVLKQGVHLMALLPPFPSARWSSEAAPELPSTGYPGERLREAWGPKDPRQLGEFVGQVVSRYKDRMKIWEFLNEPIYTDYALPGEGRSREYPSRRYTPADYVRLLKVAAAAEKKSDPTCKVMGGIAGPPNLLTRDVIEAGCLEAVDIFNLHMYPGHRLPESYVPEMDALLKLMDEHGGRKPIWITEFSYYGSDELPRTPFVPGQGSWSEERLLAGERECAELTIRYYACMMARGVEKIFIHSGASGSVNDPHFECCLMGYGGAPQKAFSALAVFSDLMGGKPKYAAEKRFGGGSGYAFAFETGTRAVAVVWTTDEDARATLAVPPAATECLNFMGNKIAARPVPLSGTPVYLLGPAGKAKELEEWTK